MFWFWGRAERRTFYELHVLEGAACVRFVSRVRQRPWTEVPNTLCLLGLCAFPAPSVEYSGFSIGFEKDTKERRVPPCEQRKSLSPLFFLLRGCLFLEATSKSVWFSPSSRQLETQAQTKTNEATPIHHPHEIGQSKQKQQTPTLHPEIIHLVGAP